MHYIAVIDRFSVKSIIVLPLYENKFSIEEE